jgi:hypothetical protein
MTNPEMEFLDINSTRVFFSMLFTVPSIRGFYRNPYSSMVLKILFKKSVKQELASVHEKHFVERKKLG